MGSRRYSGLLREAPISYLGDDYSRATRSLALRTIQKVVCIIVDDRHLFCRWNRLTIEETPLVPITLPSSYLARRCVLRRHGGHDEGQSTMHNWPSGRGGRCHWRDRERMKKKHRQKGERAWMRSTAIAIMVTLLRTCFQYEDPYLSGPLFRSRNPRSARLRCVSCARSSAQCGLEYLLCRCLQPICRVALTCSDCSLFFPLFTFFFLSHLGATFFSRKTRSRQLLALLMAIHWQLDSSSISDLYRGGKIDSGGQMRDLVPGQRTDDDFMSRHR